MKKNTKKKKKMIEIYKSFYQSDVYVDDYPKHKFMYTVSLSNIEKRKRKRKFKFLNFKKNLFFITIIIKNFQKKIVIKINFIK